MTGFDLHYTDDEFADRYTLVRNTLNPTAGWRPAGGAGYLFTGTGPEGHWLRSRDPRSVWTWVPAPDAGHTLLVSGTGTAHALGYVVTTAPVPHRVRITVTLPNALAPDFLDRVGR